MMRILSLLAIAALAATGCATSGLSGTTNLHSTYNSTVQADGAETTTVDISAKGKAGDVLEAVSNASLITKDGTGSERSMSFGANQSNDATRRAESIDHYIDKMVEMSAQVTALTQQLASIAAPLIGQHIDTQGAEAQASIAAKGVFRQQLIEALQNPDVLKAIKPRIVTPKPAPVPQVQPEPVIPEPSQPDPVPVAPPTSEVPPVIPPLATPEP